MFGNKNPSPEESHPKPAPARPPGVKHVPAPPPVSSWTPPEAVAPPAPPAPAPAPLHVTADYAEAAVFAANHIAVQGSEEKIILDVATDLRDGPAGTKLLPVAARVVMTAQTAGRLVKALEQALTKLKS